MKTYDEKILITGALGQIGTELIQKLSEKYGAENVVVTDIREKNPYPSSSVHYISLDVLDFDKVKKVILDNKITTVYHLASLLSGTSEKKPLFAWDINVKPLIYLLELAKDGHFQKLFWPSSIGVFGTGIPKNDVHQDVVLNPTTVYGISKLAGEKWCNYYHDKYGVDVRSIRYPGLISWKTPCGGGTTDYAVEIFYKALEDHQYQSYIREDTAMPMLYMDDAIDATLKLMEALKEQLTVHTSYNLGGLSFTPTELSEEIKKHIPDFKISYQPDFRQAIADSWPASINDEVSKKDWGLHYSFDLPKMTEDMIKNLKNKLAIK